MKKLLFLFFVLSALYSNSQSKHGFDTGIDTLALKYKIQKRVEYFIVIDSSNVDTIMSQTKLFDSKGYLIEIRDTDYLNRHLKNRFPMSQNSIKFEYNESGYLVNEVYNMYSPIHSGTWGKDTITKVLSQTWKFVNNEEILTEEFVEFTYPEYQWSESCTSFYHPDGRQKMINCILSPEENGAEQKRITTYHYNENDLLIEIKLEYNYQRTIQLTTFEYEYY